MSIRKAVGFGLCAALAGFLPAMALAEPASVALVCRPDAIYTEYKITDAVLGKEIATLKPGSYTRVYLTAARELKFRLLIRDPVTGGMIGNSTSSLRLTPDMAGKEFGIRRTNEFWVKPETVEEAPSDLSSLDYYPDLTGALTLGSAADPYDRTYGLLFQRREAWDEVSSSSDSLTVPQRQALYSRFKLPESQAWANLFPGWGWGSFSQGDWPAGLVILTADGVSTAAAVGSGAFLLLDGVLLGMGGDISTMNVGDTAKVFLVSLAVVAAVKTLAMWRSLSYAENFNGRLAQSLDVTP